MRLFLTMIIAILVAFLLSNLVVFAQPSKISSSFKIARLKYGGGGDWYNGPTEEPNLLRFVKQHTLIDGEPAYQFVEILSDKLFTYPFLFMTGHGNIVFGDAEARRLRTYLENGGFLYVDDDYGMDPAFRREIRKVFPDRQLVELPFSYGLFHCHFDFPGGVPKIHEHDGKPAQAFGLFHRGRLVVLYTHETNPSDGWDDPDVHNDSPEKREEALRFGTNILVWALTH